MTIKGFAKLVGCNPQTLRYYDHIDLLKPIRVDQWSSYRYYEESQALTFIKIRNLQKAGFTIDEIKSLIDKDNQVIFEAFEAKIAEAEQRLQEIRSIQKSYQTEMTDMKEKLKAMRETVSTAMETYDAAEEFGIDEDTYSKIKSGVNELFENVLTCNDDSVYEFAECPENDIATEESPFFCCMNNPEYEIIYEKHDWKAVKDFYDEFSKLENRREYVLLFKLEADKTVNVAAFANTILGLLLLSNPEKGKTMTCNTITSDDGKNHFWLLRKK